MQRLCFSSLTPQDSCQLGPQVFFEDRGKQVSFPEGPLMTFNAKKKKHVWGEPHKTEAVRAWTCGPCGAEPPFPPDLSPLLPGAVDGAAGGCCVD